MGDIIHVDVDQFYGIEYDEFPARIAEVAMWLIDHQMNLKVSEEFGQYFVRLPLSKAATIVNDNALRVDWETVVPKDELNFILGNPPFYGYSLQTKEQKEDLKFIFANVKGAGVMDYVAAWYIKAANYIQNTSIDVAFVSTNSISQGEQVGILWNELYNKYKANIFFAHRTFRWDNEAKGKAAVHVVIIGFTLNNKQKKYLYDYEDIKGEPQQIKASNINPYLVEGNNILIEKRSKPLCNVTTMTKGSSPTDGGFLLLSDEEKNELIENYPNASKLIRQYVGSKEYINKISRWCLWLKNSSPKDLKSIPPIMERIKGVKKMREESRKAATRKWADFPTLFIEERQPETNYILIPRVSSENRKYIPMGYLESQIIISDGAISLPTESKYTFGNLTSSMHMTWVKYTCGRLKSDFRYSNTIVYNNYPFPKEPSEKNKAKVEKAAQKVLDVRASFPDSSLADLYDPLTMPSALVKAHRQLDKAVDLCYRPQAFTNERNRIEFLFELYEQYTMPLMTEKKKKTRTPNKG